MYRDTDYRMGEVRFVLRWPHEAMVLLLPLEQEAQAEEFDVPFDFWSEYFDKPYSEVEDHMIFAPSVRISGSTSSALSRDLARSYSESSFGNGGYVHSFSSCYHGIRLWSYSGVREGCLVSSISRSAVYSR